MSAGAAVGRRQGCPPSVSPPLPDVYVVPPIVLAPSSTHGSAAGIVAGPVTDHLLGPVVLSVDAQCSMCTV